MSAVTEGSKADAGKAAGGPAPAFTAHPYRWVLLFATWLNYLAFGVTSAALAPLVPQITTDLQISHTAMGTVLGCWQLVYIGSAVLCGALLDRIGIRRSLIIAGLIITCSGVLRGFAPNYSALLAAVALFGLGGPLVSIGAPKLASQWFTAKQRPVAMGLVACGSSVGVALSLILTHSVMMPLFDGNWRHVLFAYAGFVALVMLFWMLVTAHPIVREQEKTVAAEKRPSQMQTLRALLALPSVRMVLLLGVGVFGLNHGINNWLPEILRHSGMPPSTAGFWAAVPAVVGILGPLLLTRFATPERRFALLTTLLCCAGISSLLLQFGSGVPVYIGLTMMGVMRGTLSAVAMLVLIESPGVGSKNAGAAGGLYFTAGEIGGVLGPVLVGTAYDLSGSFSLALGAITILCLALIGIVAMLRRLETAQPAAKA